MTVTEAIEPKALFDNECYLCHEVWIDDGAQIECPECGSDDFASNPLPKETEWAEDGED